MGPCLGCAAFVGGSLVFIGEEGLVCGVGLSVVKLAAAHGGVGAIGVSVADEEERADAEGYRAEEGEPRHKFVGLLVEEERGEDNAADAADAEDPRACELVGAEVRLPEECAV